MVQFNLDQYLAGSDLVTITSGDLAAHNPDQFEGTVNSLGITFEARLRTVSEKNLFAHFDYVKFASPKMAPGYLHSLPMHFGWNGGLNNNHLPDLCNGVNLVDEYVWKTLQKSHPLDLEMPNVLIGGKFDFLGGTGQIQGMLPDQNVLLTMPASNQSHFELHHKHFTEALGHMAMERVVDWQLRVMIQVLKTISKEGWNFFDDSGGFHITWLELERMNQELRLLQALVHGSSQLGDKPHAVRACYELLHGACVEESASLSFPFFPETSGRIKQVRSFVSHSF